MRRALAAGLLCVCASAPGVAQDYKAYQNYDFIPGDKILFDDDFRGDTDGEFPAHWKLTGGQAVVNKLNGEPVFALTDGNYAEVAPRVKPDKYLPDVFTVEFDFFPKAGSFEKVVLYLKAEEFEHSVTFGADVSTTGFEHNLSATIPGGSEGFDDKWHHAALAYKNKQVKCYIDEHRVLVVPDAGDWKPEAVSFAGIGDATNPVIFKNVRIAAGGGMMLIDQLTKEGKIVTHGINFDVDKATVKPQSMGTVAAVVKLLKDNPTLKLEIGGHTDADGDAAKNLALSQERADAVRKLLVEQGVDAARLAAKGYGATKPIDSNQTPEGKANNRRVEFSKLS
jgi:OOP family OmpA-OmpF porin